LANLLAVDGAREEAQPIGTITAPAE
jgi:hypothetical protein